MRADQFLAMIRRVDMRGQGSGNYRAMFSAVRERKTPLYNWYVYAPGTGPDNSVAVEVFTTRREAIRYARQLMEQIKRAGRL